MTGSRLTCVSAGWAADRPEAHLWRAPNTTGCSWLRNGVVVPGATAATLTAASAGSYACRPRAGNRAGTVTVTSAAHAVSAPPAHKPATKKPTTLVTVSNSFKFGKLKLYRRKGTAKLAIMVPGAGRLKLSGKAIKTSRRRAKRKGTIYLSVVPRGSLKRKLKSKGTRKVKLKITFAPSGGKAKSRTHRVKLKRKRG